MTGSILSWHFQSMTGWAPVVLHRAGVRYAKVIDPPADNPLPGVGVIARYYMPQEEGNALVRQGAEGARQYFAWLQGRMRGYAFAHEGPNEPQPMASKGFREALNAFTVELARLMGTAGRKLVGLNLGVGWPNVGEAKDLGPAVQALHDGGHLLGLHEYSAPAMWDNASWMCLRYRRTVEELRAAGYNVPPIVIGECGITRAVIPGQPDTGWRSIDGLTAGGYLDQLRWYDDELQKDGVLVATIFTSGPNGDWMTFDVDEALSRSLADYIGSVPDQPLPQKPFRRPFAGSYRVTSTFEDHQHRKPPSSSPGIDFATPIYTPALAVHDGVIVGRGSNGSSGIFVMALCHVCSGTHEGYYHVTYRHLSSYTVPYWGYVVEGQQLGRSGSTGNSTGPHLHVDVVKRDTGEWVDPALLW